MSLKDQIKEDMVLAFYKQFSTNDMDYIYKEFNLDDFKECLDAAKCQIMEMEV
jgi:hypothetical protein